MERASSLLLGTLDSWDPSFSELEVSLEVTSLRLAHIASSVNFTLFNLTFFSSTLSSTQCHGIQLISFQHATNQTTNTTNPTQPKPELMHLTLHSKQEKEPEPECLHRGH